MEPPTVTSETVEEAIIYEKPSKSKSLKRFLKQRENAAKGTIYNIQK